MVISVAQQMHMGTKKNLFGFEFQSFNNKL